MPANSAPFEIIGAPFTVWKAPIGEAFPAVDEDPAGNWDLVGTSGPLNISDDGVKVQHSQAISFWRALASLGPRKAFRSSEDLIISFELADLTLEQYGQAIDPNNTITTVVASSGVAGTKKLGLSRGFSVGETALLVRGPSPYGDGMVLQYEVPVCVQVGEPEPVSKKDAPAMLALKFQALDDPDAASDDERFGRLIAQTADALA